MKNLLLIAMAMLVGACASQLAPSITSASAPQHHNIPASFIGQEDKIIWLCATRPRNYQGRMEEDHYLQHAPCPLEPIN